VSNRLYQSAFLIYHNIPELLILGLNLYNAHVPCPLNPLITKNAGVTPIYLPVYFLYEIMFIEIIIPGSQEKGNRLSFLYLVVTIKKESR